MGNERHRCSRLGDFPTDQLDSPAVIAGFSPAIPMASKSKTSLKLSYFRAKLFSHRCFYRSQGIGIALVPAHAFELCERVRAHRFCPRIVLVGSATGLRERILQAALRGKSPTDEHFVESAHMQNGPGHGSDPLADGEGILRSGGVVDVDQILYRAVFVYSGIYPASWFASAMRSGWMLLALLQVPWAMVTGLHCRLDNS
jgi:hypothetical protein